MAAAVRQQIGNLYPSQKLRQSVEKYRINENSNALVSAADIESVTQLQHITHKVLEPLRKIGKAKEDRMDKVNEIRIDNHPSNSTSQLMHEYVDCMFTPKKHDSKPEELTFLFSVDKELLAKKSDHLNKTPAEALKQIESGHKDQQHSLQSFNGATISLEGQTLQKAWANMSTKERSDYEQEQQQYCKAVVQETEKIKAHHSDVITIPTLSGPGTEAFSKHIDAVVDELAQKIHQ